MTIHFLIYISEYHAVNKLTTRSYW